MAVRIYLEIKDKVHTAAHLFWQAFAVFGPPIVRPASTTAAAA
jgi:hypothetical protein